MDDYMQMGRLVSIGDGWFLDTETDTTFFFNEAGEPIDEKGECLDLPDDGCAEGY